MTATVLAADGRLVVLSPTGVDALRHVHRSHVAGGWVGANSMHAASRLKLLDAGLIEWCDDREHVLGLTLAGLAAIEQIDSFEGTYAMGEATETVVVDDANAAHKLIGRSIGGREIHSHSGEARVWDLKAEDDSSLVFGVYGSGWVKVDALPPATMRVAWYDAITDGAKIVHPTGYIVGGWVRRVPTTGLLWIEGEGGDPRVVVDDEGMVEVLAPVPEVVVVVADEVTDGDLVERAWGLIANAHHTPITEQPADATPGWSEAAVRWRDDYHAHLAADRGEAS